MEVRVTQCRLMFMLRPNTQPPTAFEAGRSASSSSVRVLCPVVRIHVRTYVVPVLKGSTYEAETAESVAVVNAKEGL